jgi:transposase-like protein
MVHTMKDQSRESARTRRLHDRSFKDDMVAQSLFPGASVAAIAMKGGINANLLFKWRRAHVRATDAVARAGATLMPVCAFRMPLCWLRRRRRSLRSTEAHVPASSSSRSPAPNCAFAAPSTRPC